MHGPINVKFANVHFAPLVFYNTFQCAFILLNGISYNFSNKISDE
jgi:hypothetical protein